MYSFLSNLGLTDLISEMHKQLRAEIMQKAHERLPKHLSEMELYLLALVEHKALSISEAAREMGITRQGAHKSSKHLLDLGYIDIRQSASNKREKYLYLTPEGLEVYEFIEQLKAQQEHKMVQLLQEEQIHSMKATLLKAITVDRA